MHVESISAFPLQPRRCKEERLDKTKPGGFPPGFVFVVWSLPRLRAAALQQKRRAGEREHRGGRLGALLYPFPPFP